MELQDLEPMHEYYFQAQKSHENITHISPTLIEYWDSMGYVMICHQKHNLILGVSKMGYTSKYTSGC
jgi:hypothetical protein